VAGVAGREREGAVGAPPTGSRRVGGRGAVYWISLGERAAGTREGGGREPPTWWEGEEEAAS
jgi:hypothetical protein